MKTITKKLKQEMQNFDESHQRLEILKDKYDGETAYIVTGGPSLNNHNVDELKSFLSDKLVIGIKQTYDLFYEQMDFQLLNAVNIKTYDYKTDPSELAIEEPQHSVGWHDNVKESPVERGEFNGSDEEYDDYCEACAI